MSTTTVLRAEILKLEKQAQTLEKIVYNELVALEWLLNPESIDKQERIILEKLRKLDSIQEDIDRHLADLRERGDYSPVKLAPKYQKTTDKPAKPRKTRPARKPKPHNGRTHATRLVRSKHWISACEVMDEGDGTFSVGKLMEKTGQSQIAAEDRIYDWKVRGMVTNLNPGTKAAVYTRVA